MYVLHAVSSTAVIEMEEGKRKRKRGRRVGIRRERGEGREGGSE